MGRGRGKGKKPFMTNQDDTGTGEEEKIPAQKKRGRPQKSPKDEIDESEARKPEDKDSEETSGKESKDTSVTKRSQTAQVNEEVNIDLAKVENLNGKGSSNEDSNKSNGFRQNGNRRKNKPRRAAEAVIECN